VSQSSVYDLYKRRQACVQREYFICKKYCRAGLSRDNLAKLTTYNSYVVHNMPPQQA